MKFILCLFLCVYVLQESCVDAGVIDKIKSAASVVKQKVHCGLHKVKSTIVEHEHRTDPCDKNARKGNKNGSPGANEDGDENYGIDSGEQELTTFGSDCLSGVRDNNGKCVDHPF